MAALHRQPQVAMAGWWELTPPDENAYLKPDDGFGFKHRAVDSLGANPIGVNGMTTTFDFEPQSGSNVIGANTGSVGAARNRPTETT
jgi:hypothetical protein